jgi:hypothetical protein
MRARGVGLADQLFCYVKFYGHAIRIGKGLGKLRVEQAAD